MSKNIIEKHDYSLNLIKSQKDSLENLLKIVDENIEKIEKRIIEENINEDYYKFENLYEREKTQIKCFEKNFTKSCKNKSLIEYRFNKLKNKGNLPKLNRKSLRLENKKLNKFSTNRKNQNFIYGNNFVVNDKNIRFKKDLYFTNKQDDLVDFKKNSYILENNQKINDFNSLSDENQIKFYNLFESNLESQTQIIHKDENKYNTINLQNWNVEKKNKNKDDFNFKIIIRKAKLNFSENELENFENIKDVDEIPYYLEGQFINNVDKENKKRYIEKPIKKEVYLRNRRKSNLRIEDNFNLDSNFPMELFCQNAFVNIIFY